MAFKFAKKYNTEKLFNIDTSEFEYVSLADLYTGDETTVFPVRGIYINTKGNYDDAPVIATDEEYVNLPAHLTTVCKEILSDREAIRAINEWRVGFTIYKYTQKRYGRECYSIRWADTNPADFTSEDVGG